MRGKITKLWIMIISLLGAYYDGKYVEYTTIKKTPISIFISCVRFGWYFLMF